MVFHRPDARFALPGDEFVGVAGLPFNCLRVAQGNAE
jgi:hypothetical protein